MRFLVDTNILIYREDSSQLSAALAEFIRICAENQVQLLVHPLSLIELEGDSNTARREITLSKVHAYPVLELAGPSQGGPATASVRGVQPSHDEIDSALISAVRMNSVDFLVSNDRGLWQQAVRLGLGDRVLNVASALEFVSATYQRTKPKVPSSLRRVPLHSVSPDDPFFDSLKNDYPEFRDWYIRKSKEGAYGMRVLSPDRKLGAILIPKEEVDEVVLSNPDGSPDRVLPRRKRLKLSTLKVAESVARQRLSELLIHWALRYARDNGMEEAYLTVFDSHPEVIEAVKIFGFEDVGRNQRGERIMLKVIGTGHDYPELDPLSYLKRFYPGYRSDSTVKKFVVPIQPGYHSLLFPAYRPDSTIQTTLEGTLVQTQPAGNAIRKAYLCRSQTRQIRPGDLLLFYRSRDLSKITHVGVTEKVILCKSPEEIIESVGNRTVLSLRTLEDMCSQPPVLTILFWDVGDPPGQASQVDFGAVGLPIPQSITEINELDFRRLCNP